MDNVSKSLEELIAYIQSTKEYQDCIQIREKMDSNQEIKSLIEEIKKTQKKYIKNEYDSKIKKELDSLEERLKGIPIYSVYLERLEKVNDMISYVEDRLNTYFMDLYQ